MANDISPDDFNEPLDEPLARGDDLEADGTTPRPISGRARVYGALSPEAFKEHILWPLHQMRLRGMTRVDMARHFNCSVRTIERWLSRLNDELKKEANLIDPTLLIGEFQREMAYAQQMALDVYDTAIEPLEKIAASKEFRTASENKVKLLAAIRLSESTRIIPPGVDKSSHADESIKLLGHVTSLFTTAVYQRPEAIDVEYEDSEGE